MRLLARAITTLVRVADLVAGLVFRVQQVLTGILPVLLPPKQLTELIRNHYDDSYRDVAASHPETCYKWTLESWEEAVIVRHKMTSGTILVLGAAQPETTMGVIGNLVQHVDCRALAPLKSPDIVDFILAQRALHPVGAS